MATPAHHRRGGFGLTEALVALFVMAIGLLSLLTLFPLGALAIGQALKDDRCYETTRQAEAFLRAYWQARVVEPLGDSDAATVPDPLVWAMDDPNTVDQVLPTPAAGTPLDPRLRLISFLDNPAGFQPTSTALNTTPPNKLSPTGLADDRSADPTAEGAAAPTTASTYLARRADRPAVPSYPVVVDPIAYFVNRGGDPTAATVDRAAVWVARNSPTTDAFALLPRRKLEATRVLTSATATDVTAARTCTMLDDWTYAPNGAVANTTAEPPTRQGRFTWAAVLQLPDASRPAVCNLTVLCFDGRPSISFPDAEKVVSPVGGTLAAGRTVSVAAADVTPADPDAPRLVRRTGWFMDGTIAGSGPTDVRHAKFYRITSVTENGANLDLEFEPPVPAAVPNARLYFFAGLAEAIERPPLAPLR